MTNQEQMDRVNQLVMTTHAECEAELDAAGLPMALAWEFAAHKLAGHVIAAGSALLNDAPTIQTGCVDGFTPVDERMH